MKTKSKSKIKNILCSLTLAIIMMFGANYSFAALAIDSLSNFSVAEYKPTDVSPAPYKFTSTSGWKVGDAETSVDAVRTKLDYAIKCELDKAAAGTYKPEVMFDGTSTTLAEGQTAGDKDYDVMKIIATNAPVKVLVDQKDEDGNYVFKKTGDDFDYVQYSDSEEGTGNKIFSKADRDKQPELFDLIDGETDKYYKKIVNQVEKNSVFYYQTTSSTLSLAANSYYVVSAWVWTKDATASLYIEGTNIDAKVENIQTNGSWTQYYIFIESITDVKTNIKISFYYGNKTSISNDSDATEETGAVYLDNVNVQKISETDFNNKKIGSETNEQAVSTTYYTRYDDYDMSALNGNFENVYQSDDSLISIYQTMYGQDAYNSITADLYAYQYYINQYKSGSTTEKLDSDQLDNLYRAYSNLTVSRVLESKEFEKTVETDSDKSEPEGQSTEVVPGASTFNNNNHILKLVNNSQKYNLGLLSHSIPVRQFGHYKLTLFVKGLKSTDKATIKLISYIKTGNSTAEGAIQTKEQSINAFTESSDFTNNWVEVNFYIQGNSFRDTTFQIALLAETESTIYVDSIRLESIASTSYSDATSSKKFDLSPSTTAISGGITNGYFDYIETDSADPSKHTAPYAPANWKKLDSVSADVVSGIVTTHVADGGADRFNEAAPKIGNPENPIGNVEVNGTTIALPKTNVLAIYAPRMTDPEVKHTFGYKTKSTFSLSSNSVYKITFQVFASANGATDANFEGTIFANLVYSEKNVSSFETDISATDASRGTWQTYTFVVRTGSKSRSCSIELGIKESLGTVFFQKVGYTKLAEKTVNDEKISVDTQYAEIESANGTLTEQITNKVRLVNFDGNSLVMHSENKVEGKDYYSSLSHSLREAEKGKDPIVQGELGVIDTTEADGFTISDGNTITGLDIPDVTGKFALVIHNSEEFYTLVNSNTVIDLSSSSYYSITLFVRTKDIASENGLNVVMDKISAKFTNVNTEFNEYGDLSTTGGFKKFTVLVQTGSSTISGMKIYFELGTEKNEISGTALIAGLQVQKLADEKAFNEAKEAVANIKDGSVITKNFSSPAHDDAENDEVDNLTLATFFLVFSSILLVAVLVFAIVSVYIKKAPKTKTVTGTNNANVVTKKDNDISSKDGFI